MTPCACGTYDLSKTRGAAFAVWDGEQHHNDAGCGPDLVVFDEVDLLLNAIDDELA